MTDVTDVTGGTDIARQAAFFQEAAAVRPREDLSVLRVAGDDAHPWLNGQTTHDVRTTRRGDGTYGLVVSPKGKVLADVWVLDRGKDLAVVVPRATRELLMQRFTSQIFMEAVEVTEEPTRVVSVQGPEARSVVAGCTLAQATAYACDELGRGGVFVLTTLEEFALATRELAHAAAARGGGAVDDAAFDLARLRVGRPRFGVDFGDRNYPQEAGLKDLAVSFSKGCYLGQEVVCTLEHRGRLHRRLVRLDAEPGTIPDTTTLTDAAGETVGSITSIAVDPVAARVLALGYAKLAVAEPGAVLHAGGVAVTVRGLAGGA